MTPVPARAYKNQAGRALEGKNSGLGRAGGEIFKTRNCADKLVCVLLNWYAVVHLVHPEDLRVAAVASQLVVLAHDQRLDRLGRADFGAQPAKAAAGQVEIEVIENFDLLPRLAVAAERNQVVGAGLGALVANDAGLGAGAGLG